MLRSWLSVMLVLSAVVMVPSCGHDQQLVSIDLQPKLGFVFEGLGAQGQFTALGTYIHPPETKDITNQVVWKLDIANFGDLTQTGQITYTRADGCGSGDVIATHYDDPNNLGHGQTLTASAPVKGVNEGTDTCKP
ncbi:MAG: hypothetical protein LAO09_03705 [Acidobacteriia bacterium]|nr:hypothetical protein [Terriglobia bacterium]